MDRSELIPTRDFCTYHSVSHSFINRLEEAGFIELVSIEEEQYVSVDHINELEKLVRLHLDLDINPEGVEAIAHLLQRMQVMQQQLRETQQRLRLYEGR
jgi:chaperone modulatory protein CbpM